MIRPVEWQQSFLTDHNVAQSQKDPNASAQQMMVNQQATKRAEERAQQVQPSAETNADIKVQERRQREKEEERRRKRKQAGLPEEESSSEQTAQAKQAEGFDFYV